MLTFPYYSLEELKQHCPSKQQGRSWKAELNYRNECKQIISACGDKLSIPITTVHRAVVLLHRFFTRNSSSELTGIRKWAIGVACLFLATKIDSVYQRLENLVHASFVALRKDVQKRSFEPDYYSSDGTPGNPTFLANLKDLVAAFEMGLLYTINFDFNVDVPTTLVIYQLKELGLTDEAAAQDSRVAAIRKLAYNLCEDSVSNAKSVMCLMYPADRIALACISKACKQLGYSLKALADGSGYTPAMSPEQLAAVEIALSKRGSTSSSSRQGTPESSSITGASTRVSQQQKQHSRPGTAAAGDATPRSKLNGADAHMSSTGAASHSHVQLGVGFVRGRPAARQLPVGSVGNGSHSEAMTVGPRFNAISPDSETGPDSTAGGAAAGQRLVQHGSADAGRQQQHHDEHLHHGWLELQQVDQQPPQQQQWQQQQQQQQQPPHGQQQQQQLLCGKRTRDDSTSQPVVPYPGEPLQKKGGMVAA